MVLVMPTDVAPMREKVDGTFLIVGIKRNHAQAGHGVRHVRTVGSPAAQVVVRRTTWFSLLRPHGAWLGTKYASTCTLCGVSTRLDKEQALRTVALAQQMAATSSGAGLVRPGSLRHRGAIASPQFVMR